MNAVMPLDQTTHYPVMLKQVLSIVSPKKGGIYIDCTFGGGGYSEAILKHLNTKVIALDRDSSTINRAEDLRKKFPKRFSYFNNKFSDLEKVIDSNEKPDAIIFDLGISSFQLKDPKRGFSFKSNTSINMEMGLNESSVYEVVNNLGKTELANIIRMLGDEKDAKKIANNIASYRKKKPIKTSEELSLIIRKSKKIYGNKRNPATKTFQALRIFVNKELTELVLGLIAATKILSEGGCLIIVSFHSLEDKIVKYFFNLYSNLKRNPSRYLPFENDNSNLFIIKNKKPLTPERKEIIHNNPSRSAKLRFAIRNKNKFFFPEEFIKKFKSYSKIEGLTI